MRILKYLQMFAKFTVKKRKKFNLYYIFYLFFFRPVFFVLLNMFDFLLLRPRPICVRYFNFVIIQGVPYY